MKYCLSIILFLLFTTGFFSCEKSTDGYGKVTIHVVYQNAGLAGAGIYIKKGSLADPGIPLNQYDTVLTADNSGQAIFNDVAPGFYYFLAKGFSTIAGDTVRGGNGLQVLQHFRGDNTYDLTIKVQ